MDANKTYTARELEQFRPKSIDKEFAVYLNLPKSGGEQEMKLSAKSVGAAKKEALSWPGRVGEVIVKYYEDGDLRHQWDYVDESGVWTQYE